MKDARGNILPDFIEYIREWSIEDPSRYERISGKKLTREVPVRDPPSGDWVPKPELVETVMVCVLVIPNKELSRHTNMIGRAPHLDSHADYLMRMQTYGVQYAQERDELLIMQVHLKQLEALVRKYAADAGDSDRVEDIIEMLRRTYPVELDYVKQLRKAIDEEKASIAAKILAAIPDDED
jgi:hypothetical protein